MHRDVLPEDASLITSYARDQERRNLSVSACRKRACSLRLLADWIAPRPLIAATTADIEAWLDSRRLGPQGRTWHVSNVASFYRWCVRDGHLDVDPTVRVVRPRLPRRVPRPWAKADIAVAVEMAEPRMRCWLLLAGMAGLRVGEIAGLHREHVLDTLDPPLLLILSAKGGHERVVPAHEAVMSALRAQGLPRRGPLWMGQRGPLRPNTISCYVSRYLAGVGVDATAHQGRHAFATDTLRACHDLRLVQGLLGHASPLTTAAYVAWDMDHAAEVVASLRA